MSTIRLSSITVPPKRNARPLSCQPSTRLCPSTVSLSSIQVSCYRRPPLQKMTATVLLEQPAAWSSPRDKRSSSRIYVHHGCERRASLSQSPLPPPQQHHRSRGGLPGAPPPPAILLSTLASTALSSSLLRRMARASSSTTMGLDTSSARLARLRLRGVLVSTPRLAYAHTDTRPTAQE